MSYARRTDANLTAIVQVYRALGCSVHVTNAAWDLTVGWCGISELVECKNGELSPSRRKLTKAQIEFRRTWTGGIRLVTSIEDVHIHVKQLRALHRFITAGRLSVEEMTK